MPAALPANEAARLQALKDLNILDTLPEQAYQDIVAMAAQICDTPVALMSLVDAHRQWFKAKIGIDATETSRDSAFCAHALLQSDQLFVVPDATLDPRFADNPLVTAGPQINFYAGAPLTTDDGLVLGTLCVIDHKPRTLTERQHTALAALARQVMEQLTMRMKITELEHAHAQLREMAAHQDSIREEERRRIAREIHDELGSVMTGIRSYFSFQIDHAQRRNEPLDSNLLDALSMTDSAIETVRRVITDLRPSVLDQLGIWAALEWHASELQRRTDLRCIVDIDQATHEVQINSDHSTALYRIVQEALTNCVKHADATEINLLARSDRDAIRIDIRDNGCGIAAPELLKSDSWGITGMYERARHFGFTLAVSGEPGCGTLVSLQMPSGAAR